MFSGGVRYSHARGDKKLETRGENPYLPPCQLNA